jgi:cysteine desulfurase
VRLAALGGVTPNGHATARLAGSWNVAIEGIEADALLAALDDVAVSTGSACSSATPEPSHVLRALGLSERALRSSIRIGLGRDTTEAEIDRAAERIADEVRALRAARSAARVAPPPSP